MRSTYRNVTTHTAVWLALLLATIPAAYAASMHDLVFSGDASFNGPHGGQPIHVAVVQTDTGDVVALASGTVSKGGDPAFSFDFPATLEDGKAYEVDYWIDSNFGGGAVGTCDPKTRDHQWRVALGTVTGNVAHKESHRPAETADVCAVFSKQ